MTYILEAMYVIGHLNVIFIHLQYFFRSNIMIGCLLCSTKFISADKTCVQGGRKMKMLSTIWIKGKHNYEVGGWVYCVCYKTYTNQCLYYIIMFISQQMITCTVYIMSDFRSYLLGWLVLYLHIGILCNDISYIFITMKLHSIYRAIQ